MPADKVTDYPPIYYSKTSYAAVMAFYDIALSHGPASYETRMVNTRHGQTHVVIGGPADGQPVIVFHGWNGSAAGTGSEFPFLFNKYRVYIPDIIGHAGRSAPHRPETPGSTYADWACDVLDALDIRQALVMGISGGGWMTLKFAAYYPQRVAQAVAISTDGLSTVNTWGMLRGMMPAALFPNRVTARWFMEFVTSPGIPKNEQSQKFAEGMRILLKHFKTQGNPGLLPDGELDRITSPLLVLMGEYERIFKPHVAVERARKLIPGLVSAEIVPNSGHLMTADQPDWMEQRILRFIQAGV